MFSVAADTNTETHRVPQERGQRSQAQPWYRVLLDAAQVHRGRILHQRNRNQIPRLHWQYLPEGISRLPRNTGSLVRISIHFAEYGSTICNPVRLESFSDFGWH